MKVYRIPAGTYFEKQEDARKADRKFEAVDFPFAASPKADFVEWLNQQPTFAAGASFAHAERDEAEQFEREIAGDYPNGVGQPAPVQPVQPQAQIDRNNIEGFWPSLPLTFRFHLCALTMEDARDTDFMRTTPDKAPQRYGKDA